MTIDRNMKVLVVDDYKTMTRIIRGLRMFKIVRLIVGLLMKQRMMYRHDGFALDLSYITNTCIAMSRPAVGSDANFANPIEEVARFFTTKYPDRFLIFDLCTKASYGDESFHGRVERCRGTSGGLWCRGTSGGSRRTGSTWT